MTASPNKLPPEWRKHFLQMPLLAEEEAPPPKPGPPPGKRPRGRPPGSAVEHELLSWIGYYRYVTTAQVIERFWTGQGKGSRYGYAVLKGLKEADLLSITPLEPGRGGASIRVLQLTKSGWGRIGESMPADASRPPLEDKLLYRIQLAETMLVRGPERWRLIEREHLGPAIKARALSAYRGRVLTTTDQALRDAIQANKPPAMPLHGLRHLESGDLRILLPVRRGLSAKRLLDRMPANLGNLTRSVTFEIVAAGHDKVAAGVKLAEQFGREFKVQVHTYSTPHFATRQSAAPRK